MPSIRAFAEALADLRGADKLTARELEVLYLRVAGMRYKQVADRLFVSEKTVESHLAHASTKLGMPLSVLRILVQNRVAQRAA